MGGYNNDIIPERAICEELGIQLLDGMGDKIQSSSWLLQKELINYINYTERYVTSY
jgi:hypothetical protein